MAWFCKLDLAIECKPGLSLKALGCIEGKMRMSEQSKEVISEMVMRRSKDFKTEVWSSAQGHWVEG